MAADKRPSLPVILMANDLLEGDTVFWAAGGWSRAHEDALVAADDGAADALAAAARAEMAANRVVDATLVDVTLDAAGSPEPRPIRERIRVLGPTVRTDLAIGRLSGSL